MRTVLMVVGARPNFVKVAPLVRAMRQYSGLMPLLVHTGQHYDYAMSQQFFDELDIPDPDINLEVGSGDHGVQTGEIMKRLEPVVRNAAPDLVLVLGDVNSTLAGALVSSKLGIRVGHVEAGLRSFDRRMPEEINRVVADVLSDFLFVPEAIGVQNLRAEGIAPERIFLVGDIMIDSLIHVLPLARDRALLQPWHCRSYAIATFHRPSNVDDPLRFMALLDALFSLPPAVHILFPVHPRTRARLEQLLQQHNRKIPAHVSLLPPQGYVDFIGLLEGARFVLTDSGGIQNEAAYLDTPCLTFRDTSERVESIAQGMNVLLGNDPAAIGPAVHKVLAEGRHHLPKLEFADGNVAPRILRILCDQMEWSLGEQFADLEPKIPT